jgi:hypothetical protein
LRPQDAVLGEGLDLIQPFFKFTYVQQRMGQP